MMADGRRGRGPGHDTDICQPGQKITLPASFNPIMASQIFLYLSFAVLTYVVVPNLFLHMVRIVGVRLTIILASSGFPFPLGITCDEDLSAVLLGTIVCNTARYIVNNPLANDTLCDAPNPDGR
jgi:hypothetical protein